MWEKLKSLVADDLLYVSVVMVLVAVVAFGLGRQSVTDLELHDASVSVEYAPLVAGTTSSNATAVNTVVVASKNGAKYHLPDCPGAQQINDSNLIRFTSIEEAKAAGYTPAANCPGL